MSSAQRKPNPTEEDGLLGRDSLTRAYRSPQWAANFLGIPVKSVLDAADRGELPCVRLGQHVRFDPVTMKSLVNRRLAGADGSAGLDAPADKFAALLEETRRMRQEALAPRAARSVVEVESIPMSEAAQLLGCSTRQIQRLIASGTLERGPKYGRAPMVTRASLEAALRVTQKKGPAGSRGLGPRSPRASPRDWQPVDGAKLR